MKEEKTDEKKSMLVVSKEILQIINILKAKWAVNTQNEVIEKLVKPLRIKL